ncbi:hypothetical protein C8E95_2266 [Pseudonocardia autotrophica]|uniref:Uncharacterized protein n=2 Tax=Pseudonocardia TaxID=1847 RepID=A0A1Y2MJI4_PSEAH|nr:hypothetical protein BG845_06185 [Pseudonocardia autotrophica]TDN73184.1 hypothetical protein C8E95_2266 [Pseudonocardia autotrophica]BBG03913.1 hypothetical protein Pdca_51220 [Pseudonocardia autotrophica]GEC28268.1 hypothetical protein PSA01_52970 [Pseudonocardia saturnea]
MLRPVAENVDWTACGDAADWGTARGQAVDALRGLIVGEGRVQEYRIEVDAVPGIVWPGLDDTGRVELAGIDDVIPVDRDQSHPWLL